MADIFDEVQGVDANGDIFDEFKTTDRTFGQSVKGGLQAIGEGAIQGSEDALNFLTQFISSHPQEIVPGTENQFGGPSYRQSGQKFEYAKEFLRHEEELTSPERYARSGSRFVIGTSAFPGAGAKTALSAGATGLAHQGYKDIGIPEGALPYLDLITGAVTHGAITPKEARPSIGKQTKPSGLPTRRYEGITKETKVSPGRREVINKKVEGDFKKIASDIVETTPLSKTARSLKEDASFIEKVGSEFERVEALAADIPGSASTSTIKANLLSKASEQLKSGLSPSEYDSQYAKYMKEFSKSITEKEFNATDSVKQFRKNNQSLTEYFEPGSSKAVNKAKRDALLDYNRLIAEHIETQYPGSEFSKLFTDTNKRWSDIKSAEFVEGFIKDLFDGKIDYRKGSKFFNKRYSDAFKKALGDEGYSKFEQLMKDFMSTQRAQSLLKTADSKGFHDLATTGISYLIHPKLAALKIGKDAVGYIYQAMLDKPRLMLKWDQGIKAVKREDFKQAEKIFSELDAEIAPKEATRREALKKFNEKVKPVEKSKPTPAETSFTTAKGSTYTVKDGKTVRNKAERAEHPGEKGIQPESEKTYYVSKEDADKLSILQAHGPKTKLLELPDGTIGVQFTSGPNKGKVVKESVISPNKNPKIGLTPVEVWKNGERVHFGNKIVSVNSKPATRQELIDRVKKPKSRKADTK